MKNIKSFNAFSFYEFILRVVIVLFLVFLIVSVVNSFYTLKPKRVNVPSFSNVAWGMDNLKLRQERIYDGKSYLYQKQLLISGVNITSISTLDNLPITLIKEDRKTVKAKYYPLTNAVLIPINDKQISELKIGLGLIRSFYILLILIGVLQVRKMLLSIKNETYFQERNSKRLQYAALIFFLMPIFILLFNRIIEGYLIRVFELKQFDFLKEEQFSNLLWLVAGIATAILSFIVKQGIKLKENDDLTISLKSITCR